MLNFLKKHHSKILFASVFSLSALSTSEVYAVTFSWKWNSSNTPTIDITNATDSNWTTPLKNATSYWRNITGASIGAYYTSYSSKAEAFLSYDTVYKPGFDAFTYVYDSNGNIMGPYTSGTPSYGKIRMQNAADELSDEAEQTQLIVHEIGHILGFGHPDEYNVSADSVMNSGKATYDYSGITTYDKNEMARRY